MVIAQLHLNQKFCFIKDTKPNPSVWMMTDTLDEGRGRRQVVPVSIHEGIWADDPMRLPVFPYPECPVVVVLETGIQPT